jgi:enoyl-CoA hydratase/carnithine racemase
VYQIEIFYDPNARMIFDPEHSMEIGEFYRPEAALEIGMVDQVLPPKAVLSKSIEKARLIGSMPQAAYANIKRNRIEGVEAQVLARREKKERHFLDCWFSDEARKLLRAAMEKF